MLNWLHYFNLIVGLGTVGLLILFVVLSIFAKPFLDAAMAIILPILQAIGDGLGVVLRGVGSFLWNVFAVALPDFFKGPWQDRVALLIIVSSAFIGGHYTSTYHSCPAVRSDVRAEYKLVLRSPAERRAYLKRTGQQSWWKGLLNGGITRSQ